MDISSSFAKLVESKALEILEGEAQTSDSQTSGFHRFLDFTDFSSKITKKNLRIQIQIAKF